ncbi:PH domain-containing protein DDB_G0274775-like [Branchiostoma floridae]|uniref:PH domain-containing protein DDB_G0274775-like n=1 Tax=Branchiostoma floridae TaxID=7739 RepID=A0A9J7L3K5_BRAFL|nr:PH domain-containing protein DDB_G0274775-like [Branchiostoma floridae]
MQFCDIIAKRVTTTTMDDEDAKNYVSNGTEQQTGGPTVEQNGEQQDISGWLMKRSRLTRQWRRQWFCLKGCDLQYGDSAEKLRKTIPVTGAQIEEANVGKPHAFSVKPRDSDRVYLLHADSEEEQRRWVEAICLARMSGTDGDQSQACVIQ